MRCYYCLVLYVTFWMFFEQAGSSFNFLAQNLVNRDIFSDGSFIFPDRLVPVSQFDGDYYLRPGD